MKGEWILFVDEREPDVPHLVIKGSDGNPRIPTVNEMEHAVQVLNEEGSTVIRLSCKNPVCKDFKGWIERSRKDAEKNVYHCQVCGKAMER